MTVGMGRASIPRALGGGGGQRGWVRAVPGRIQWLAGISVCLTKEGMWGHDILARFFRSSYAVIRHHGTS